MVQTIIIFLITLSFSISAKGEENNTIFCKCRVINRDTGAPVPNAVIAVYSSTSLYSTDIDGLVNIRLQENDSVRIVILGYSAETYRIKSLSPDTNGYVNLQVYPVSYLLKEVTVKGYKGLLDPTLFPSLKDDEPAINIYLPEDIGSKMSNLPPNERLLMKNPTVNDIKNHPVSYIYSRFSKEEKSIKRLHSVRYEENNQERLSDYISPETIALITGYEGKELENFIIYCNANLKFNHKDNGASVTAKIEVLFEKYKELKLTDD